MLFRRRSPSSGHGPSCCARVPDPPTDNSRALVWVDVRDHKEQLALEVARLREKAQHHEKRVEHFHQVAVPGFQKWMKAQFSSASEAVQTLEEQRQRMERRLRMADQLLSYAPHLRRRAIDEILDQAEQEGIEPLLALQRWICREMAAQSAKRQETASQRRHRLMRTLQEATDPMMDLILARFQQEFEDQAALEVSAVPQEWVQQIIEDFIPHFEKEDGDPILSLLYFLRLPEVERGISDRVRNFVERHFPRESASKQTDERSDSFRSTFEEFLRRLGGKRFETEENIPGQEKKSLEQEEELKAVFRRLARQLHPDTGTIQQDATGLWMEVQRLYQAGEVAALLRLEVDLQLKREDLTVAEWGLSQLLEAKQALEQTLKKQKSEWAKLARRPEAKWDRSRTSPSKLEGLQQKFHEDFLRKQSELQEQIDQIAAFWNSLGGRGTGSGGLRGRARRR